MQRVFAPKLQKKYVVKFQKTLEKKEKKFHR